MSVAEKRFEDNLAVQAGIKQLELSLQRLNEQRQFLEEQQRKEASNRLMQERIQQTEDLLQKLNQQVENIGHTKQSTQERWLLLQSTNLFASKKMADMDTALSKNTNAFEVNAAEQAKMNKVDKFKSESDADWDATQDTHRNILTSMKSGSMEGPSELQTTEEEETFDEALGIRVKESRDPRSLISADRPEPKSSYLDEDEKELAEQYEKQTAETDKNQASVASTPKPH